MWEAEPSGLKDDHELHELATRDYTNVSPASTGGQWKILGQKRFVYPKVPDRAMLDQGFSGTAYGCTEGRNADVFGNFAQLPGFLDHFSSVGRAFRGRCMEICDGIQ